MSGDQGGRRLLPQNPPPQSFSFVPSALGQREPQKNYVFVDEHNRHKRLKVMRACEGCRRRKIKCDAATTNTWPCSACIRLKIHCVPPTVNYDASSTMIPETDQGDYESGSGDDDYHNQLSIQQQLGGISKAAPQTYPQQMSFSENVYQSIPYEQPAINQSIQYETLHNTPAIMTDHYNTQNIFPMVPLSQPIQQHLQQPLQHSPHSSTLQQPPHHQSLPEHSSLLANPESPEALHQDQLGQQDLADILGMLNVSDVGTAPYLARKKGEAAPEDPAFEDPDDYKHMLPLVTSGPDRKIRIPPELMPDDMTVLHYLDVFFTNVHPYVPVLNKPAFYQQWYHNREAISPLVLECIFAIAGRFLDEPSQGQQWLALAGKHADSFMDVPRLSTLQGLLILLKAREAAPKRGYYYRSWMLVVHCVAMGKDLGLDEHYDDHKAGTDCGLSTVECATRTRIWQTIFMVELMVGSPQGRRDLSVNIDTVDVRIPQSTVDDDDEFHISRNFTYFSRVILNVRLVNNLHHRIGKNKDWASDPRVAALNPLFENWLEELPLDLQITFPDDGSNPWIPTTFIGNLHSYYYLSIIMLHRPQLMMWEPSGADGKWKDHMLVCYSAAKCLCRLQESMLESFGLVGLLCMQRGINFTIYAILTCTVLHLVAITSPDPDLHTDARDFFARHMRILEKCTSSWPMPDMQLQIDTLREAFSADTRKPFVLKPSFPYSSPGTSVTTSPPRIANFQPSHSATEYHNTGLHAGQTQAKVSFTSHPLTPPISTGSLETDRDYLPTQNPKSASHSPGNQQQHQHPVTTAGSIEHTPDWNPTFIFARWNSTFAPPPAEQLSPVSQPSSQATQAPGAHQLSPASSAAVNTGLSISPASQIPQQYPAGPMAPFTSPSMWQEDIARLYEGGLKRQWDYDGNGMTTQQNKRSR